MDRWIDTFRKGKTIDGYERILIPGDPEREAEEKHRREGIILQDGVITGVARVADELGVDFGTFGMPGRDQKRLT